LPNSLFDLVELRSFSSIWYWIVLAVFWARVSHAALGVPADLVRRARTGDDQARRDVELLLRLRSRRRLDDDFRVATFRVAAVFCLLTVLVGLGIIYGSELAQAILLIAAPYVLVGWLDGRLMRKLPALDTTQSVEALAAHRAWVQGIALCAVFVTAVWGTYHNLAVFRF
jgi:hypothetical protein